MAIVFCIVNDIDNYASEKIKSTITNIANYTIANLKTKGYEVLVDKNEDKLLQLATRYDYAVVMSPGTEYINGTAFFEALEELIKRDFFVAGHILDRTMHSAYYELHHQCYVVNMAVYNAYKGPTVGFFQKDVQHTQLEPKRSTSNIHDDYTPHFLHTGTDLVTYNHKCHGWNFLRIAFENNLPVIVFEDSIRNNKIHYYPESEEDFNQHYHLIKEKLDYCKNEFIHTDNTEWTTGITEKYEQIVLPASGTLYLDLIDSGRVVFYDYNQKALDYWKELCPQNPHIDIVFVYTNLLEELSLVDYIDPNLKTLVNLSNIFCYEGTVARYCLDHRIKAQNALVEKLEKKIKNVTINFSLKAEKLNYML